MQKAQKFAWGAFIAVVFIVFGYWFWSLGALASEDVPAIRVESIKANVEYKTSGSDEWRAVMAAQELHQGDAVRTDKDGRADIRWSDRGVTRLDPGSQITIETLPAQAWDLERATLRIKVESGRVWTRLRKILNLQGEMEVATDDVVATVRGTAFGVVPTASSTVVAVGESVVEVMPGGTFLKDAEVGEFSSSGTLLSRRAVTPQDVWVAEQLKADRADDEAWAKAARKGFEALRSSAPEVLVKLSEDVHLALSGKTRDELRARYAERRIVRLVLEKPNQRIQTALAARARNSKLAGSRAGSVLLRRLDEVIDILRRVPERQTPNITQLADLRGNLLSSDAADAEWGALLALDERIDDLLAAPASADTAGLRQALLNELMQARTTLRTTSLASDVAGENADKLKHKIDALIYRLIEPGLGGSATDQTGATSTSPTSTLAAPPAQTAPANKNQTPNPDSATPPAAGAAAPTAAACGTPRMSLFAKPDNNVAIGQEIALSLLGVCADGTVKDVTANAAFAPANAADGRISGSKFYPAHDGTVYLDGKITLEGKALSARAAISVAKGLILPTGVRVSTVGPTTLTTSQSVPLQAVVAYADGRTADVTYQCVWSTSDPKLAAVMNYRLQTLTGTGKVDALCAYTENGKTVSGALTFTVELDQGLQPTGGSAIKPLGQSYLLN
ncbi:MAG: FecR family protein [Patescibacteria group bacterium]